MSCDIFIPTLRSFENDNTFSGSCGMLRFFLYPDVKGKTVLAKLWHGILCIEKSEIEEERTFPMTAEGLAELKAYLESAV